MVRFRDIIRIEQKNRHRIPYSKDDIRTEKLRVSDSLIIEKTDTQDTFDLPPADMGSEDVETYHNELLERLETFSHMSIKPRLNRKMLLVERKSPMKLTNSRQRQPQRKNPFL